MCVCGYCIHIIHVENDQLYEYVNGKHLSPPTVETPNFSAVAWILATCLKDFLTS